MPWNSIFATFCESEGLMVRKGSTLTYALIAAALCFCFVALRSRQRSWSSRVSSWAIGSYDNPEIRQSL